MALTDQSKDLAQFIESKKDYLARNAQLFDIYEGNLKPYVDKILKETLSHNYYTKIRNRIYPINILKRLIDKLSRAYSEAPKREATSDEDILEFYVKCFQFNKRMNMADEFSNLFKGYALEPVVLNGKPQLRVLPFDRFLVYNNDIMDPTKMTHFLKFIGKKKNNKGKVIDVWFVYTKDEFMAMDSEGHILREYMLENEGVNPYGFIPFYYSAKSEHNLLPIQDTDTLELAKLLPVQLTDLAGAIMFQCFSIVYGVDVDSENMVMSPNAFWSFKSDLKSDKTPQIGTIKPQADIDKVMGFIKDTFATWLETRGIRVGAMGSTDGANLSSGISKIIDEMDTFESVKRAIDSFKFDEYVFWQLLKDMHNKWIEFGELRNIKRLPENWEVFTEFDKPSPMMHRSVQIEDTIKLIDNEIISRDTGRRNLYPDWTDEDFEKEKELIEQQEDSSDSIVGGFNGVATDQVTDSQEV